MPIGDGTGPQGAGPGTGRGFGPCPEGTKSRGVLRRFWGFGRRFGRRFWDRFGGSVYSDPALKPEDEAELLKTERSQLEKEKESLNQRLKEIEK